MPGIGTIHAQQIQLAEAHELAHAVPTLLAEVDQIHRDQCLRMAQEHAAEVRELKETIARLIGENRLLRALVRDAQ